MAKLIFMFAFVAMFAAVSVSGSALENLDAAFWTGLDEACQSVAKEREMIAGPVDTLFLRIIEYTTLGYNSHSVFPSAANSLLRSSHFDPSKPTVIFAHGFTDSPLLVSGQTFAAAYKIHGKYNILAIDSSKLIKMLYMRSSTLVKYIGEILGVFVHDLVQKGVAVENIHLVGHSLGGHICGFAGKTFEFLNKGQKLPRITGMDPAGPCFFDIDADGRLSSNDAQMVDVIHTNIGVYGINKTIGTCDFYPNRGGLRQPGCIESICSHNRVWQLWEASVLQEHSFIAVKCESGDMFDHGKCNGNQQEFMGLRTPPTASGTYYLRTLGLPPFGMGLLGAKA